MKKRRGGLFTTDVSIGMVLIMLLLLGGIVGMKEFFNSSSIANEQTKISNLCGAISRYKYEMKAYPSGLAALTTTQGIYGPWIESSVPTVDRWGNAYNYRFDATHFAVWGNGPNGTNNSGGGVPTAIGGDDIGFISR